MTELKQSYSHSGMDFTLYRSTDTVAWYKEDSLGISEIFLIKHHEGGTAIMGGVEVVYEPGISYPRDNAFGTWAWCASERANAERIYNEQVDICNKNLQNSLQKCAATDLKQ